MAFKMTPGIKGNSSMNRIKNLGACGGPGQPPCEPRFQKEVEEKRMRAIDRSSSSISRSIKPKIKQSPIKDAPVKPAPVKLQINLPEGYKFGSKKEEVIFYEKFSDLSGFKSQEELDKAIRAQLAGSGPVKPIDPEGPIKEGPIKEEPIKGEPIKGGGEEFEASPIKSVIKSVIKK